MRGWTLLMDRRHGKILFPSAIATERRGVFLAGSSNDWDPTRTAVERQGDGSWRAELELAPGRYEYEFVIDGAWYCEPGRADGECVDCVPSPFGTLNCVIEAPGAVEANVGVGA
jgi:1,4-alpha-glucan branching enzyme